MDEVRIPRSKLKTIKVTEGRRWHSTMKFIILKDDE